MKYLNLLYIAFLLLAGCSNEKYDCYIRPASTADNLKIKNTFNIEYPDGFPDSLLLLCRNNGIKTIDSIQIGFFYLPSGLDSNQICIYEKECIKRNKQEVRQRKLFVKLKDRNNFNINISQQFYDTDMYEALLWRFYYGKKTVSIRQDETISYDEAKEILDLINTNKIVLKCDIGDLSPQKDLERITGIAKENNVYRITFNFYGHWPIIVCTKENNKLIVKEYHMIMT